MTKVIKENDVENLKQWQGGDIVTFVNPDHTAVLSTKRNSKGIPYLIHNSGPYTREADEFMNWYPKITGHFRFPAK